MIHIQGVTKSYGQGNLKTDVLKDIHLTVSEGEYVAIMGPSGSGKSTLMNILGALDRPTQGTYQFQGRDLSQMEAIELARVRNQSIGFIFQQFQLLSRLTAQKNVELPLIYAGIRGLKRKEMATTALNRVGLADRRDHLPSELSGGQQQRVAIARALVNQPDLLLADEPTGALDQASGDNVLDLFDGLHQEGKTIVMITHDSEVAARANRRIDILDGRIKETSQAGGSV
ncbi:ABC transporter ATP-binding protein [Marininema halotolerans]|uniref:Putative ABC transport system ATP-binding protein n=1 Tax=Marininema halotolerans TaxID=1155944 RepID=A0A1I6P7M5_9BACL|nr:ABC transporter ATP-binding protein [Marininema halotolerans]SFS36108.1 putative ABC transport system ATP-binding protein [Marininema halotolerans]